jgi:hypothetical protein
MSADTSGVLQLASNNGTTAVTIDTAQNATFAGYANMPNTFGFKNRIINGAMVIDQRALGTWTNTTSDTYTLDRWQFGSSQASKFTAQQSSTAPTGFINSMLITSSSAYTVGASETFNLIQRIEGLNCTDLAWGSASAQTVTLSFWVRSSLTGTFGGALTNSAFNRSYPYSYTISSANTWEYKTVTIAGDTSGTWLTTNGAGIVVRFSLGTGSSLSGTAGAWSGSGLISATGATSVVGTNGATFYITGVQLEKGSTATSFDYRPYGTELALCQRYYWKITQGAAEAYGIAGGGVSGNACWMTFGYPVTMRASPTTTVYGSWAVSNCGQPTIRGTSTTNFILQTIASATAAVACYANSSDDIIDASAEL